LSGFGKPLIERQPGSQMSDEQWTDYVQRIAHGEQAAD
jgi:hypothetical protein